MRSVDDHIVGSLNSSLPTNSFKHEVSPQSTCRDLFQQLLAAHAQRDEAIRECILTTADSLRQLRTQRDDNRNDLAVDKCFKAEQRKVSECSNDIVGCVDGFTDW